MQIGGMEVSARSSQGLPAEGCSEQDLKAPDMKIDRCEAFIKASSVVHSTTLELFHVISLPKNPTAQ